MTTCTGTTTSGLSKTAHVAEINRLHREIDAALRTSLEKAIRIGELLAEQKAALRHGQWGAWVEANLSFTIRTATNYMGLYKNRNRLKSETVSDLAGAYRLLAAPRNDANDDAVHADTEDINAAHKRITRKKAKEKNTAVAKQFTRIRKRELLDMFAAVLKRLQVPNNISVPVTIIRNELRMAVEKFKELTPQNGRSLGDPSVTKPKVTSTDSATKILKEARPEILKAVQEGDMTVTAAARELGLKPKKKKSEPRGLPSLDEYVRRITEEMRSVESGTYQLQHKLPHIQSNLIYAEYVAALHDLLKALNGVVVEHREEVRKAVVGHEVETPSLPTAEDTVEMAVSA